MPETIRIWCPSSDPVYPLCVMEIPWRRVVSVAYYPQHANLTYWCGDERRVLPIDRAVNSHLDWPPVA